MTPARTTSREPTVSQKRTVFRNVPGQFLKVLVRGWPTCQTEFVTVPTLVPFFPPSTPPRQWAPSSLMTLTMHRWNVIDVLRKFVTRNRVIFAVCVVELYVTIAPCGRGLNLVSRRARSVSTDQQCIHFNNHFNNNNNNSKRLPKYTPHPSQRILLKSILVTTCHRQVERFENKKTLSIVQTHFSFDNRDNMTAR